MGTAQQTPPTTNNRNGAITRITSNPTAYIYILYEVISTQQELLQKMFEREEVALFDLKRLYKLDESQYYNIENQFHIKCNVIDNSTINISPTAYKNKSIFVLRLFANVDEPLLSQYERIVHHKQNLLSPSKFMVDYFREVNRKFYKIGMEDYQIKKQIFGEDRFNQPRQVYFMRIIQGQVENKQQNNSAIKNYLKEALTGYKEKDLEDYLKYIKRDIDLIIVESRQNKQKILEERIYNLKPFLNVLLLQNENNQKILLCNRYEQMHRFRFQFHQQKIRQKSVKKFQTIMSLEDMILSFKESEVDGKLSEENEQLKRKYLQKMYKHLCYELRQLQSLTYKLKHSLKEQERDQYVYKLNPLNVMFNVEKQFFFLKIQPIIVDYLLQYTRPPKTIEQFFSEERRHYIECYFMSPEEMNPAQFKTRKIKNTNVYRLMRVLGSFDQLNLNKKPFENQELFLKRKLDGGPQCQEMFGKFVCSKLNKIYAKSRKDQNGPDLDTIFKSQQFEEEKTLESLHTMAWFRSRIARHIIIEEVEKESKTINEENRKKIVLLKMIFYCCLMLITRKIELDTCYSISEKKELFQDYCQLLKKHQLDKLFKKTKMITLGDPKHQGYLKKLRERLELFIEGVLFSKENKDFREGFSAASNDDKNPYIQIKIDNPEDKFKELYEEGKNLFEGTLYQSKREHLLFGMMQRVTERNVIEKIIDVYHPVKKLKSFERIDQFWKKLDQ